MGEDVSSNTNTKLETNWPKVLFFIYLHMSALYSLLLVFTQAKLYTTLFCFVLVSLGTLSITTGCHRLWTHRSYSAVWQLRLVLAFLHTFVCQGTIYDWVLKHRLHHKYNGTDNDPFNCKRGFQFAQLACHCVNNPSYKQHEKEIDMSDIEEDSIVMFQKTFYWILMPLIGIILPINAPIEYWGESMVVSMMIVGFTRVTLLLHASWFVNTATIIWGYDPLDKSSSDTNLVFFVNKSLWPQYHYLLPWDYKTGEYGTYGTGCSTAFIRVWASLGLAYDLRTIDSNGVKTALAEAARTGTPVTECLNAAQSVSSMPDILDSSKHAI